MPPPVEKGFGSPYLSQHQSASATTAAALDAALALRRAELHHQSIFLSDRVHAQARRLARGVDEVNRL